MSAFVARMVMIIALLASTAATAQVWKPRGGPKVKPASVSKPETRTVKTSLRPKTKGKVPPNKHHAVLEKKKKKVAHHRKHRRDDFTYTEEDFPSE
jgi:hypothetical protein